MQFPSLSTPPTITEAPPLPRQNFKVVTLRGYTVISFMRFSTFTGFKNDKWTYYRYVLYTCTCATFIPGGLLDFLSCLHNDWVISYHVYMTVYFMLIIYTWLWFKITDITHALPNPVYLQTDFTPKWVVVSCVHDTVVKFCTGVKFLLLHNNRDELTLVWLTLAWHFVVVSCHQIQSHEREPEWTCTGAKVALLWCKHPLSIRVSTYF